MACEVKIIEDSINISGNRITTYQLKYWRGIHSELMTHRVFSRNASSSRAIPIEKMISQVRTDPAGPVHWGLNQKGMQAYSELPSDKIEVAKALWKQAANSAADQAEHMNVLGLHKQVVNRVLEPFQYIHVVLTATEFNNFFDLRDHPAAQPEIQELAIEMRKAMEVSIPKTLMSGRWHIPYIMEHERHVYPIETLLKISTARCARVSYITHGETSVSVENDVILHDRLVGSVPIHASPTEHQAMACSDTTWYKNFRGWKMYRYMVEESLQKR